MHRINDTITMQNKVSDAVRAYDNKIRLREHISIIPQRRQHINYRWPYQKGYVVVPTYLVTTLTKLFEEYDTLYQENEVYLQGLNLKREPKYEDYTKHCNRVNRLNVLVELMYDQVWKFYYRSPRPHPFCTLQAELYGLFYKLAELMHGTDGVEMEIITIADEMYKLLKTTEISVCPSRNGKEFLI